MRPIVVAALFALTACKPAESQPVSGQCEEATVTVTVLDSSEHVPPETSVSWSTRDSHTDCETADERTWTCLVSADEAGATVTAGSPGFEQAAAALDVEDGCVADQEVDLALEPAGAHFTTNRTWYVQLIPDDYECEHSWELYDMNCYRTAEFCSDGWVEIVHTDIASHGVYELRDGEIAVTTTIDGDMPDDPVFEVLSDTEIRDPWLHETWTLDVDGKLPYSHCP